MRSRGRSSDEVSAETRLRLWSEAALSSRRLEDLADACPVPKSEASVFLMPSSEGDEVDVCLSHGFRERNLTVCDRNPAIVAHLKRRYPPGAHGGGAVV